MDRRRFLRATGTGVSALLAGCTLTRTDGDGGSSPTATGSPTESPADSTPTEGGAGTDTETPGTTAGTATPADRTLRVATYPAFLDAPSSNPGGWVKRRFEERTGVTLKWFAPEQEMNYFVQRARQGLTIDADVYLGLTNLNLASVDRKLGEVDLFRETPISELENGGHVLEKYRFDSTDRVVPDYASFVSLVYDEAGVPSAPDTYAKLVDPAFEDALLVPNPQSSVTGEMFLLLTINEYDADGYLDYWDRLVGNGAKILGSWGDAYNAYSNGEAPIVVSYSTDQVYAKRYGEPMSEHRIAFPDGQGYAYIEGMARFVDTDRPELCKRFMEFVLSPEVQRGIAKRNVGLTVTDNASLPSNLAKLVYEPDDPVSFSYDRLKGNLDAWVDQWSKRIATK